MKADFKQLAMGAVAGALGIMLYNFINKKLVAGA